MSTVGELKRDYGLVREPEPGVPAADQDTSIFSTEASAITLLFELVVFGRIEMRKINRYQHMTELASVMAVAA